MAEQTCPPLGTGSIDFNALHDALKKGKVSPEEAIAAARAPTEPAAVPAPQTDAAAVPGAAE